MNKIPLKKFASVFLVIVLLITVVPANTFAASAKVIGMVKITGATILFKDGDKPVFTAESAEPKLYSTRLDTFEQWTDVDTGATITSSEYYNGINEASGTPVLKKFVAGHTYAYSISVQALDPKSNNTFSCSFDKNTKISVNGKTYSVPTKNKTFYDFDGVNYNIRFANVLTINVSKDTTAVKPKGTALSSVKASKKGFTVKWKKQTNNTTGYQIQYATNSKFTKGAKTITISKNTTTSKKVTKLASKKNYYVRIRTYTTISGKKYTSNWSKTKKIKTK